MTVNKLLLIAATVLLAILGCLGADWFWHGHKSIPLAFAAFAAACWVGSQSWPWFTKAPPR